MADVQIERSNPPLRDDAEDLVDGLRVWWFSGIKRMPPYMPSTVVVSSFHEVFTVLDQAGPGIDLCELCGSTHAAVRRGLANGRNIDLLVHADLNHSDVQADALRYLDQHQVFVLVVAPPCHALTCDYTKWRRPYEADVPHVRCCGLAALHQVTNHRRFLCAEPSVSDLNVA